MTNFAPVAPPELLMLLKKADLLGNYHLLLAHDVVARPELYKEIFDDVNATIIMDNSLIELGSPVDIDVMEKAISIVPSTYAVLPDHLGDCRATVAAVRGVIDEWYDELRQRCGLLAVVQGSTESEIGWCINEYKFINREDRMIDAFSIPKILGDTMGSRRGAIELCIKEGCLPIHLLGFSDDAEDDAHCAQMQNVMGIDSAVPLRLGMHQIQWSTQLKENSKRGDYWERASKLEELPYDVEMNMKVATRTFQRG